MHSSKAVANLNITSEQSQTKQFPWKICLNTEGGFQRLTVQFSHFLIYQEGLKNPWSQPFKYLIANTPTFRYFSGLNIPGAGVSELEKHKI